MRAAALVALCATLASPAMAERRVYAGEEAEALKCVHLLTMTPTIMERAGYLSTRDKDMMVLAGAIMLDKYVSGTGPQKLAGLKAVGQRRDVKRTLTEFKTQSKYCIRRFPLK